MLQGTATFLAVVSTLLQETDRWCIFYPIVKRLLRADVKEITDLALLDNAREPVRYFFCLSRKSRSECLYCLEYLP